MDQGDGRVEIRFADAPDRCVTASNWGTTNGTELTLWDCSYPTTQEFTLTGQIRNRADKT